MVFGFYLMINYLFLNAVFELCLVAATSQNQLAAM